MLLIATALALLVIYAGMKLMALTTKETLGTAYKVVSWFIVIMGFLLMLDEWLLRRHERRRLR
jgi:hypothetical protein